MDSIISGNIDIFPPELENSSTTYNWTFEYEYNVSYNNLSSEFRGPVGLIIHTFEPTGFSLLNYAQYNLWFLIIDFILILPTLFGNLLIFIALVRYGVLRKIKGFILIGNLAVSDFLVGLIFLPMDITLHLLEDVLENGTYCLCYYSILCTLLTASVLNLLLLSVERYHAVTRPYSHKSRFTTKRLVLLISITWLLVLLVGFLPLFGWRPFPVDSDKVCKKSVVFTDIYQETVAAVIIAALTISFLLFIAVIRIALRKAKETKSITTCITDKYPSTLSLKTDIHFAKLLLFVSGLFIICWLPFYIMSFVPISTVTVLYTKNLLTSLGLINSCLNWIVYGVRNRKFRAAFKDILTLSCWQGELNISSSSS